MESQTESAADEIRQSYVGAVRAGVLLKSIAFDLALYSHLDDETARKVAAILVENAVRLRKIIAWLEWSPDADWALTKAAASGGAVTFGIITRANAHQVIVEAARMALAPFEAEKFDEQRVADQLADQKHRVWFELAVAGGSDGDACQMYDSLLVRLRQEVADYYAPDVCDGIPSETLGDANQAQHAQRVQLFPKDTDGIHPDTVIVATLINDSGEEDTPSLRKRLARQHFSDSPERNRLASKTLQDIRARESTGRIVLPRQTRNTRNRV